MPTTTEQLVEEIAERYEVPADLLREMLKMEREVLHLLKRRGLVVRLQELLKKRVEDET